MTTMDQEGQKRMKCKECVNFICCREDNQYECDFEYWGPIMYEDAVLYTPELFECDKYEDITLL